MRRRFARALSVAAAVLVMVVGMAAQTHGDPEEFTSFAINMGAYSGAGGTAQLIMTVNQWATQEERDAFFVTLKEKGAEALLQQLRRGVERRAGVETRLVAERDPYRKHAAELQVCAIGCPAEPLRREQAKPGLPAADAHRRLGRARAAATFGLEEALHDAVFE